MVESEGFVVQRGLQCRALLSHFKPRIRGVCIAKGFVVESYSPSLQAQRSLQCRALLPHFKPRTRGVCKTRTGTSNVRRSILGFNQVMIHYSKCRPDEIRPRSVVRYFIVYFIVNFIVRYFTVNRLQSTWVQELDSSTDKQYV